MGLRPPASFLGNNHGIRPFGYLVEFASDPNPSQFGSELGPWKVREAQLQKVDVGYGSNDYCASLKMWDANSVEAPHILGFERDTKLAPPRNGELVRIWHFDSANENGRLIFKGAIRSVNERKSESGIEYNVEVLSDVRRLDDLTVTFSANVRNDPINPSPRFNNYGAIVEARLKTVAEIIEDILLFPDAWGRPQWWRPQDIRWAPSPNGTDNTLKTDPRCGLFKPSTLTFQDTPKGKALEQVLQLAGNYTFLYVPDPTDGDYLMIVELNQQANRCGLMWDLHFASTNKNQINYTPEYAHENSVMEDATEWSSRQTCNAVRLTTGPIRFYSGQYIIPKRVNNYVTGKTGKAVAGLTQDLDPRPGDTAEDQIRRSLNPDLVYYRFDSSRGAVVDKRKHKTFVVGMPLFPDWNVHEDYLPELVNIDDVAAQTKFKDGTTKDTYIGLAEWNSVIAGDIYARGSNYRSRTHNLRVWQAWHATEMCPACAGTGHVKEVYSGGNNEPQFQFLAVSADGSRVLPANPTAWVIDDDEKIDFRVTNYLFPPAHFGNRDEDGQPYGIGALQPLWNPNDSEFPSTKYAPPWKHLCPYCRGVGLKPEFKIRNLMQELFQGRNNQLAGVTEDNPEIPVDPDLTATGPETWEQAQTRLIPRSGLKVQTEASFFECLPNWEHRNKEWKVLLKDAASDDLTNPSNPKSAAFKLPHPLQYKQVKKILAQKAGLTTPADTQLADPTWGCYVPYTRVTPNPPPHHVDYQLGQVVFERPHFIPCFKEQRAYLNVGDGKLPKRAVSEAGTLIMDPKVSQTADANGVGTGFWRVPRVWLQGFYMRPFYYRQLLKDKNGDDIDEQEVVYTTDEGDEEKYACRAMILDGRYTLEIIKKTTDYGAGGAQEFSTGNRVMMAALSDENLFLEVHPDDLEKMPCIPGPSQIKDKVSDSDLQKLPVAKGRPIKDVRTPANYLEAYKTYHAELSHVRGRLLAWEQTSPGEKQREMEGYGNADWLLTPYRPKFYSWAFRDMRPKMLELGIKRLEAFNNIQVNGALTINGKVGDISTGLGWVDYPDRARAVVRRLTYNYSKGFYMTLELSVERARLGELPPDASMQVNQVIKDVKELKRLAFIQEQTQPASNASNKAGTSGDENTNKALEDGTAGRFQLFLR